MKSGTTLKWRNLHSNLGYEKGRRSKTVPGRQLGSFKAQDFASRNGTLFLHDGGEIQDVTDIQNKVSDVSRIEEIGIQESYMRPLDPRVMGVSERRGDHEITIKDPADVTQSEYDETMYKTTYHAMLQHSYLKTDALEKTFDC